MRYLSPDGWPASILRFAYYVGLPYIALILGVVPGRYLGLVGLNQLAGSQISSPAGPAGTTVHRDPDDCGHRCGGYAKCSLVLTFSSNQSEPQEPEDAPADCARRP